MVEVDIYEAIQEAIVGVLSDQIAQQQIEIGDAWVWDAIRQGTKEAISEAINEGKIEIKK